ncbi:hypothetical protein DFH28DRAFT_964368 [Melampsora americana]|nr:hypothetical protein DFH28DRAFT_964368 [Melampsora americana]
MMIVIFLCCCCCCCCCNDKKINYLLNFFYFPFIKFNVFRFFWFGFCKYIYFLYNLRFDSILFFSQLFFSTS